MKQTEIHFPAECPAPTREERILQIAAVALWAALLTAALVAMLNPMPWSTLGHAKHTQTQEATTR